MATVLERFIKLGIPWSSPVLQKAGEHVANELGKWPYPHRKKKLQEEGERLFYVNDYPEELTSRVDFEILNWLQHQPSRHERYLLKLWWKEYKQRR